MLFSLTLICIKLWLTLGAENVIDACDELNCNQWKDLRLDLFQRTSSWGYFCAEYQLITLNMAFGQYFMQRCVACATLSDARKALSLGRVLKFRPIYQKMTKSSTY